MMPIQPDEDSEYWNFVLHHLVQLTAKPLPPRGFHYTTGEGLIGIIESGSLRATQIARLNDSKEFIYSGEELQKAIQEHRKTGISPQSDFIFSKMLSLLEQPNSEIAGAFVTCFTEEDDDLS
jgi:hypothetical protein